MKKTIIHTIIIALLAGVTFLACEPDKLMLFEKDPDVYFTNMRESFAHSRTNDIITVRFFFLPLSHTEAIVRIPITITGSVVDYDRPVSVGVLYEWTGHPHPDSAFLHSPPTSASPHHYVIEPTIIPAGKLSDTVVVRIQRTPDLALDTTPLLLKITLLPNEHFGTDFRTIVDQTSNNRPRSLIEYRIVFSDIIVEPRFWGPENALPGPTGRDRFFGPYSEEKFMTICRVNDCPPGFLDGGMWGDIPWPTSPIERTAYHVLLATRTQMYLNQRAVAGDTVFEVERDIYGQKIRMAMGPQGQP